MNKMLPIIAMLAAVLLGACTPTIYGVPETAWQQMSEPERVAAMEAYRQHQIVLQQAQAERARQRAIEQEAERQRQEAAQRRQQQQIDAIYRGQGVYGDLLQVTLSDGMINFSGQHHYYPPQTFRIAQGETRDIVVVDNKGRRRSLQVSYGDGTLVLDSRGAKPNQVARFRFDSSWEEGITFSPVATKGDAELRGVRIAVSVLGEPPHRHRQPPIAAPPSAPPQVIVVQPPASPPPQIVVIEPPNHRPFPGEHREEGRQPAPRRPAVHPPAVAPAQPDDHQEAAQPQHPRHEAATPEPDAHPAPPAAISPRRTVVVEQPTRPSPADGHQEERRPVASRAKTAPPAAADLPPRQILVKFRNGLIKIKGKYQPLTPAEYRLTAGNSLCIALQTPSGDLRVTMIYREGKLTLDPGPDTAKGKNKHEFVAEQSWARGRAYRFDSPGNKLLKQVEVEVVGDHSG